MKVGGLITLVSQWRAVQLIFPASTTLWIWKITCDKPKLRRCLSIEGAKKRKPQTQASTYTTDVTIGRSFPPGKITMKDEEAKQQSNKAS